MSKTNYTAPPEETPPPIMNSKIFQIMEYQNKTICVLLFPLKSQRATGNKWNYVLYKNGADV